MRRDPLRFTHAQKSAGGPTGPGGTHQTPRPGGVPGKPEATNPFVLTAWRGHSHPEKKANGQLSFISRTVSDVPHF